MKKDNYLEQVEEFHKTFGAPVLETPKIPSKDRYALRVNLIQEELEELKEAIEKKDLVSIADALCDLQYVLSGTVLEFGMKDRFNEMFNEVHSSNMSKACESEQEAQDTIDSICEETAIACYYIPQAGKFVVKRQTDEKIMKSINYSKADLVQIVNR